MCKKYSSIGRRTAHMTRDERIASYKSVLQHARKHNNITYTCNEKKGRIVTLPPAGAGGFF